MFSADSPSSRRQTDHAVTDLSATLADHDIEPPLKHVPSEHLPAADAGCLTELSRSVLPMLLEIEPLQLTPEVVLLVAINSPLAHRVRLARTAAARAQPAKPSFPLVHE